jgi:sorting and assembly machinery component 37
VDYLRQYSDGAWNLDENLGEVEQADSVAYVSHILHAMFIFN